jgi:hypothetical protein
MESGQAMANEKIVEFLKGVLAKTKAGRITWEPTVQESTFIAAIGGQFALSISSWTEAIPGSTPAMRSSGQGTRQAYALVLRDEVGRQVVRVTDTDEGISASDMRDLYEAARRQAVRADERIEDAIGVLKSL